MDKSTLDNLQMVRFIVFRRVNTRESVCLPVEIIKTRHGLIISLVHEQGNGTSGLVRGNSGGHSLDGKGMVASMVDKSGMVEMPDGSKVVLMTQLEDGSYVQIKGEGASKVSLILLAVF